MIREELAALRALLGSLVLLARNPETLWRRIGVHEVCDAAGQCLALTQVRGGKVGNGSADLADWRIQITVRAARRDSDNGCQLSRAPIRKAQSCPAMTARHPPQREHLTDCPRP